MNRPQTPTRQSTSDFANETLLSKMEYLQTENAQLQDQVHEMTNLLNLNRQALRLMNGSKGEMEIGTKGLQLVVKNLQEENDQLQRQIDKLIVERNSAQNQVLLNQQITEAAQRHEKETIMELEQKINSLKNALKQRESQILHLEQTKPNYDEMAGIVIKYRDIISPDKAIMKLHNEIEMLNERIVLDQRKMDQLKKEKNDVQTINFKLTAELLRLRQSNNIIIRPEQNSNINGLVKFQKDMLKAVNDSTPESSDNEGSPVMSPLPIKNEGKLQKGTGIPKLDLTRAKQIQEINAKRQIQQMQEKQNKCVEFQVLEKIQKQNVQLTTRLEKVVDELRKNLQREMLQNRTLVIQNDELIRVNEEIEHRNHILSKSNVHYEEAWRKIQKQYRFLQSFYITNKDQAQTLASIPQSQSNTRALTTPKRDIGSMPNEDSSFQNNLDLERQLNDSLNKNIDLDEDIQNGDGQVKTHLQNEYYGQKELDQNNLYYYYVPTSIKDARKFLLGMAQNMYVVLTPKIEAIIEIQPERIANRIQRSMSDVYGQSKQNLKSEFERVLIPVQPSEDQQEAPEELYHEEYPQEEYPSESEPSDDTNS